MCHAASPVDSCPCPLEIDSPRPRDQEYLVSIKKSEEFQTVNDYHIGYHHNDYKYLNNTPGFIVTVIPLICFNVSR